MHCLNCKYDLRKLAEHRCPECGRKFDPTNRRTYYTPRMWSVLWRRSSYIAITTYLIVFYAVVFVTASGGGDVQSLVVRSLELWPYVFMIGMILYLWGAEIVEAILFTFRTLRMKRRK
jgi:hypothetical protein